MPSSPHTVIPEDLIGNMVFKSNKTVSPMEAIGDDS
jgi:hypothetical protein